MMNTGNDNEMQTMLKVVNIIRELNYPQIPQVLVEKIIEIERDNVNNRDFAYQLVSKLINDELRKFD